MKRKVAYKKSAMNTAFRKGIISLSAVLLDRQLSDHSLTNCRGRNDDSFSAQAIGRQRCPNGLPWQVVTRLCDNLSDMPQLTSLDLGGWKCQKYGLLSDHGQSEGWVFKHLPNLRHLKASDVSSKFFQNLCTFCIKLETLK